MAWMVLSLSLMGLKLSMQVKTTSDFYTLKMMERLVGRWDTRCSISSHYSCSLVQTTYWLLVTPRVLRGDKLVKVMLSNIKGRWVESFLLESYSNHLLDTWKACQLFVITLVIIPTSNLTIEGNSMHNYFLSFQSMGRRWRDRHLWWWSSSVEYFILQCWW